MLFHHLVGRTVIAGWSDLSVSLSTLRSRLLGFQGKLRAQHFMSDSMCQQKQIELQLLLEALFNVRSSRNSTWDPGAKEASLAKFCKGYTHQHVFGCEVGLLPAVPPEDVKVSPPMPRTYTLHAFAPAPCACTCVQGSPHRYLHFHGHLQHIS